MAAQAAPTGLKQKISRNAAALVLPALVAAWPVISIFVENQNQLVLRQVVVPLLLNLLLAAGLFALAWRLLKNAYQASLLSSIVLAMVLLFIPLRELLGQLLIDLHLKDPNLRSFSAIGIYCALFVVVLFLQLRKSKAASAWQQAVKLPAIIMAALLLYSGYSIAHYAWLNRGMDNLPLNSPLASAKATTTPARKPDIYYIILDRYASQQTLSSQYNFKNTAFLSGLETKGFSILDSHANYPFTIQSLSSSLNGQYLPTLSADQQNTTTSTRHLQDMILHNGATAFLHKQGYQTVQIGSWWDPTRQNPNSDVSLQSPRGITILNHHFAASDFEAILMRQSALQPFMGSVYRLGRFVVFGTATIPSDKIHRQSGLYEISQLERLAKEHSSQPKMVFAHILLPHPPYVFDAQGNPAKVGQKLTEKELYLDQMAYTNKRITQLVSELTIDPQHQPIVMIQADEGPYPARFDGNTHSFNWRQATTAEVQQKTGILNAYYLPGLAQSPLYPGISPVNSFRTVFNTYFGTNLPLLPDNHYIDNAWTPYKFIDLTGQLKP